MNTETDRDKMRRLAKLPNGFRTTHPDFGGKSVIALSKAASDLVLRGELFRAKFSHRDILYFDTQARADEALSRGAKPAGPPTFHGQKPTRAAWDAAQPIETAETKYTYAETPKPRFGAVEMSSCIVPALQRGRVMG